jgi:hypothetical protein
MFAHRLGLRCHDVASKAVIALVASERRDCVRFAITEAK